ICDMRTAAGTVSCTSGTRWARSGTETRAPGTRSPRSGAVPSSHVTLMAARWVIRLAACDTLARHGTSGREHVTLRSRHDTSGVGFVTVLLTVGDSTRPGVTSTAARCDNTTAPACHLARSVT